ncbi:MipA/OmpV family protein [Sulfitobacter sp. PS-8MA]|uniref:MipA/OmpV family protein n=1 Tax=Sulfitobacter sp. PS-8MA TaxID=3237707 RepID=UPI0034C6CE56
MRFALPFLACLSVAAALPAGAQERSFNFALRGGLGVAPEYPGSSSYHATPDLGFTFGALEWGGRKIGAGIGNAPKTGFGLTGSFRYLGERDASDHPELAGLEDIDAAVELGFGVVYREVNWQVFGKVRRGFGGHEGVTGDIGADVIFRPDERWTITAGPRFSLGNDRFADTYFGVDTRTPTFAAYEAEGGLLGAGVEIEATYRLDEAWALEGAVAYEHLLNDAADSPITQAGSEDQWTMRLGVSRAFNWRF